MKISYKRYYIEYFLCIVIVFGMLPVYFYMRDTGRFPPPYFYATDTLMDWFNPAYWSHSKGIYSSWGSVYPPISFVFLRFFSLDSCYTYSGGYFAHDCDWLSKFTLVGFFGVNGILLLKSFSKIDPKSALPRTIALTVGLPSLYGLERGNLAFVAFTCIILAFGPLLKSARLRWLAAGFAINVKIYILAALFPLLLKRRWRWFEGAIIATILVYMLSYGMLGAGSPQDIYENLRVSATAHQSVSVEYFWYALNYAPLSAFLAARIHGFEAIFGAQNAHIMLIFTVIIRRGAQAVIMLTALSAWLRPKSVPVRRLIFIGLAMAMITVEPGGYAANILLFFVFMERWEGFVRTAAIILGYFLCMPYELILYQPSQGLLLQPPPDAFVNTISFGPLIRPAVVVAITMCICWLILLDSWMGLWVSRLRKKAIIA
jgi:hypothetical protein